MKKVLLVLGAAVLALLVAEVALRVVSSSRGRPWSAQEGAFDARRIVTGMTESFPVGERLDAHTEDLEQVVAIQRNEQIGTALHPYTGFDAGASPATIDAILTGPASRREDLVQVFVFGGSVAAGFVGSRRLGVTEELEEALAGRPEYEGRSVRVFNMARAGFKQPQQLTKLAYLLSRGARPDLVLNLDGYNEIHLGAENAEKGHRVSWPAHGQWAFVGREDPLGQEGLALLTDAKVLERQAKELLERAERWHLFSSILTGRHVLGRVARLQKEWARAQDELVQHIDRGRTSDSKPGNPKESGVSAVEEAAGIWAESSRLMHQVCAARGIRYVHALQPTLHDAGSKPVHAQELRRGLQGGEPDPVVTEGYEHMRALGAELLDEGVEFVDLSRTFLAIEEPLYYDRCHFVKLGNELVLADLVQALDR